VFFFTKYRKYENSVSGIDVLMYPGFRANALR